MAAHLGKHQAAQTWPARQSGTLLGNVTCTHACAGSSKIEMGVGVRIEGYVGVLLPKLYRLATISTYRHGTYVEDPQRRGKGARAMGPGHTRPLVSILLFWFLSPLTVRAWGLSRPGPDRTRAHLQHRGQRQKPASNPLGPRTESSRLRTVKLLCRCACFAVKPGPAARPSRRHRPTGTRWVRPAGMSDGRPDRPIVHRTIIFFLDSSFINHSMQRRPRAVLARRPGGRRKPSRPADRASNYPGSTGN
jgi:hypothetical protein